MYAKCDKIPAVRYMGVFGAHHPVQLHHVTRFSPEPHRTNANLKQCIPNDFMWTSFSPSALGVPPLIPALPAAEVLGSAAGDDARLHSNDG